MEEDRLREYREKKKKLKKVKSNIEKLKNSKEQQYGEIKEEIIQLNKAKRYTDLTYDLYNDIKEDKINEISTDQFNQLMTAVDYVTSSSPTFTLLGEYVHIVDKEDNKTIGTLDATASSIWSGNKIIIDFSKENPNFFNNSKTIVGDYNPSEDLFKKTEYIKQQLKNIIPDVSTDFEKFYSNVIVNNSNSTIYQELIGFRSTLYLKVIFPFSETNFGKNKPIDRKLDIERFVCNGKKLDEIDEPILERAKKLYSSLSKDVKNGKTTPEQNEDFFYESISVLYAILKLKEKYFNL